MNPYNFSLLFFSFCTFFISLLIWLKRQDDVGRRYFIFSLIVTVWGTNFAILISQSISYQLGLSASRILNAAAVLIPVTWFHFTLIFTGRKNAYKKLLRILYLLAIILDCFAFTDWFIPGLKPVLSFVYYTRPGQLFHIYVIMFFMVVPLGFTQLIQRAKRIEGVERLQLKGFILATLSGFVGGSLTFLPAYDIFLPQYGLFLLPIYPFVMAYFMIRKHLFNEEEMVQAAHRDKLVAIGTLAASINHEIRNPLYVIQGLAESHLTNLKEEMFPTKEQALEKSREVLMKSAAQAHRAMEIMKRFAAFAKQGINESIEVKGIKVDKMLEDILPLVRHELTLDKIEFLQEIPEDLPPLYGDSRHLEEILFNLIVNACQALKEKGQEIKGAKIEISALQENGHINLLIKDNGPGIPPKQLSRIFEPFYTTKEEGTGLGLYVTKQLVERNEGKISVKSKIGEGTTFLLKFKKHNFVFENERKSTDK